MMSAAIPINEKFRLEALKSLNILDSKPQKEFDEITSLAAHLCDTDVALISFVDNNRQWFKSKYGMDTCETPRELSFCAHAILEPEKPFIINDAREDERFHDNPLTSTEKLVVFYTGIPLVDKDGFALGTLCVIHSEPKTLSEKQIASLKALSNQVIILLELNKKNKDLEEIQNQLEKRNDSLYEFAKVIAHDLKMPLANIITSTDVLKMLLNDQLNKESNEYFEYIKTSSFSMSTYINDVLQHYESDNLIDADHESFYINDLLKEIVDLLSIKPDFTIHYPDNNPELLTNRLVLKQVFFNLIGNSIKYNDKDQIVIGIDVHEDQSFYYFRITDNGMGIPKDQIDSIFKLFTTANIPDRSGNKGNGIGLSTVKKLITNLGGSINVYSKEKVRTTFEFSIKKKH